MIDIHLVWEGPFSHQEALSLNAPSDYGLYQYYGDHPIYGSNTLLYVGKASRQTFGQRFAQHNWEIWASNDVEIYVGRVFALEALDEHDWEKRIDMAERIILQSHGPSFNSSNLNTIGHGGEDSRILNWGKRKMLLPEVSTSRWEGDFAVGNRLRHEFRPQSR
jgi:hypothetical protein